MEKDLKDHDGLCSIILGILCLLIILTLMKIESIKDQFMQTTRKQETHDIPDSTFSYYTFSYTITTKKPV